MRLALALVMVLLLGVTSVIAADEFPVSTKQPLPAGDGWRVIYADFPASVELAWTVAVADQQGSFHELWARAAGRSVRGRPAVDFSRNVVLLFGYGTNSCTKSVAFEGVSVDRDARLVHPNITTQKTCPFLDLSSSAVFLVAFSRDRLPETPFRVHVLHEPACDACLDAPDTVTVHL